jgi:hypothetical protein
MTIRSRRETVTFHHPVHIRGIDRDLPAGAYEVVTDEEMIEGLSFAAWRRVATMITVPTGSAGISEMLSIGSVDLADAQAADAQATDLPATDLQAANGAAAGREPAAARVAHD